MNDFSTFAAEVSWPRNNVVLCESLDSTQTLARRIAAVYAADGEAAPPFWVLAHAQHSGRGRRGRAWLSPAGRGIYATRAVTPAEGVEVELLPLRVALALAEALDAHLPADRPVRLKWPNDLIVGGRKLGGILIEVPADTDGAALVGFGINHGQRAHELPDLAGRAATSLGLEGGPVGSLGSTARRLIEALDEELARGPAPADLIDRYAGRAIHRPGESIACQLGDRVVTGVFRGFGPAGELRLTNSHGETLVAAGEILEPPPGDRP